MFDLSGHKVTGFVMPIGSGAVGKTSLALTLEKHTLPMDWAAFLNSVPKSQNLEFRYVLDKILVNETQYQVLHQYLVPPGQKALDLSESGRSFENIIEIYRSLIRRVDVVLLSYRITDLDSYHDIEYWVEKVNEIMNDSTNLILVGTHLDRSDQREVTEDMIIAGKEYVKNLIKIFRPTWKGYLTSMEVSNVSGENIIELRKLISSAIMLAVGVPVHSNSFQSSPVP
ncbi:MAG: hypothetical protein WCE68_14605 [Anaerolineales bacterium]